MELATSFWHDDTTCRGRWIAAARLLDRNKGRCVRTSEAIETNRPNVVVVMLVVIYVLIMQ